MDGETDLVAVLGIKIGMCDQEGVSLRGRRIAKAVDIMVTVALGMGNADQRAEREILLHGQSGLAGQVFAGDEAFRAGRAPFGRARGIDHRLVDALAGFRRDAAIAERARHRECIIGIVGLVDDEITAGERAERRGPGDIARHRLLDIEQLGRDRP